MNKQILKCVSVILLSALTTSGACAQTLNYVRKKVQPNFFIPQKDLTEQKPEKVGLPQYKRGETTTKHISVDDNLEAIADEQRQRFQAAEEKWQSSRRPFNTNTEKASKASKTSSPTPPVEESNKAHDIPDYQTKYQEYLKDLEAISRNGTLPNNPGIQDDLSAMNSEQRIEIDKNFNANRDIQSEVNELLK